MPGEARVKRRRNCEPEKNRISIVSEDRDYKQHDLKNEEPEIGTHELESY